MSPIRYTGNGDEIIFFDDVPDVVSATEPLEQARQYILHHLRRKKDDEFSKVFLAFVKSNFDESIPRAERAAGYPRVSAEKMAQVINQAEFAGLISREAQAEEALLPKSKAYVSAVMENLQYFLHDRFSKMREEFGGAKWRDFELKPRILVEGKRELLAELSRESLGEHFISSADIASEKDSVRRMPSYNPSHPTASAGVIFIGPKGR